MEELAASNLVAGENPRMHRHRAQSGKERTDARVCAPLKCSNLKADRDVISCAAAVAHHVQGKHEKAQHEVAALTDTLNRYAQDDHTVAAWPSESVARQYRLRVLQACIAQHDAVW